MKKLLLLSGLIALFLLDLNAGPVDQQKAKKLGTRFMSAASVGQRNADVQLDLVAVATDASRGATDYYVFNVANGEGFVIIAGDDCVKPVLAYSTTGQYHPEDVAEGFAFTLGAFQQEIQYVREHHIGATPDIVSEWESVMETGNLRHGRAARRVVGPLCQTIWHQNYPYSSQCPEDEEGHGGHVYAGCVATAMAQVMKFWDWPEQGTGSHTYYPDGYDQQTANYGETEYHFELMPLAIDSTSTEDEIFYIAQFQHHCGIAVDMQYSGSGSGAYSDDVPPALRNYFRYNCDDHETNYSYWGWGGYSNEEWAAMLKSGGLDERIPLYYSGQDDNWQGGHAFVCDGYDENDYFHFNWGWSGRDDAWCPIGALNTTKYAFNMMNGFTGHIIPQNGDYYQRADSVADFTVVENAKLDGVMLSWNNPSYNLQGEALSSIESITIRRNNQVIATLTDAEVGAAMNYVDNNLEPGLYEYAIFVTNEAGISRNAYRKVLVGEKCDMIFELQDEGGDGWKGACISVVAENGQRIAVIGMSAGSEETVVVPLLRQNLSFVWNHGWYHTNEQYDTDFECVFKVKDAEGNELFLSDTLTDAVFLTYDNNCEYGPLACYPVSDLQGEYQWHESDEFGALISWDKPEVSVGLHHFNVVRATGAIEDMEVIAEVPYNGAFSFEYFDNTYGQIEHDDVYYYVNCVYVRGEEQCESDFRDVQVTITDVTENVENVRVYPNPTRGLVTVEGQGAMRISVSNLLGQKMLDTTVEGNASIDLSRYGQGVYVLRIETFGGTMIQKVSVLK